MIHFIIEKNFNFVEILTFKNIFHNLFYSRIRIEFSNAYTGEDRRGGGGYRDSSRDRGDRGGYRGDRDRGGDRDREGR